MNEAQVTSACEQFAATARDTGAKIELSAGEARILVKLADIGLCAVMRECMRHEGRTPSTQETGVAALLDRIDRTGAPAEPAVSRRSYAIGASGVIDAVNMRINGATP